jgi:glycosyltransferase involved in cell wall biosynthesis
MSGAPVRVVMLVDRYWPHVGGSETAAKLICDALQGRGYEFSVVTRNYTGTLPARETVNGVPIRRFGASRIRVWSKVQFLVGVVAHLFRRRRSYELLHVHIQQYDWDALMTWLVFLLTRRPYILHIQRSDVLPWMLKLRGHPEIRMLGRNRLPVALFRAVLRRACALIAVDQRTQSLAARHKLSRCRYIPNPVRFHLNGAMPDRREALRRRLNLPAEAFVAVAVGMLRPEKNHIMLLRAWRELAGRARRPARLVLLGGAYGDAEKTAQALREYAAAHGLESVIFAGAVSNVEDYLQAADAFVLPSLMEGTSLAILEAMACGLPVVVSDIPGNRDLVPSGEYGFLVPPGDPEVLAERLERLALDAGLCRALGANARERAKRCFSLDAMVQGVDELYRAARAAGTTGAA